MTNSYYDAEDTQRSCAGCLLVTVVALGSWAAIIGAVFMVLKKVFFHA